VIAWEWCAVVAGIAGVLGYASGRAYYEHQWRTMLPWQMRGLALTCWRVADYRASGKVALPDETANTFADAIRDAGVSAEKEPTP